MSSEKLKQACEMPAFLLEKVPIRGHMHREKWILINHKKCVLFTTPTIARTEDLTMPFSKCILKEKSKA